MRRLGCLGWLTLGWIIIPCWAFYMVCRGCLELLLMAARAAERYNRRRAVRKAYERNVARRAAIRAQMARAVIDESRWYRNGRPHNQRTGEPEDARPRPHNTIPHLKGKNK